MLVTNNRKFLKNQKVVKEIERYRWIESMKFGFDIGKEWTKIEKLAAEKGKTHQTAAAAKAHIYGL